MAKFMKTVDGNTAAAHVAYAFTDVAAIYPITPSSTMAEVVDEWAAQGRKNVFGQKVSVVEMQSEAGAAGAFHGSLQAGALTSTFTASQGLLLMIPNMYKVAGELLPGVFHVSARALASQALSIFGDHQDVMAARQTGCVLLASGSVQEVADIAPVAHLAAIEGRLPFIHFFDGFRTSHEIQKVELLENEDYAKLLNMEAVQEFRNRALSPNHPVTRGTAQNPDIYFQTREASNKYYNDIVGIVDKYMNQMSELTGRKHGLFDYYGAEDAKYVIVAMGSVTEAIEETIDVLNAQGEKYGLVKVHLYRPFSMQHFVDAMPSTVERICVLDRTKEPGATGEPLYLDVKSVYYGKENAPMIIGGRYGLGSKDTVPTHIKTVYDNLKLENPKDQFTLGIVDDVTNTSLELSDELKIAQKGTVRCKFWGLGSDGTVGANKQAIKIIGDNTEKYAQAYFAYDSKKSGGITMSHLRFGDAPIRSTYLIDEADYIACHNQSYVYQYDLLKGLKKGGIFVLNTIWNEDELNEHLPAAMKNYMAKNDIQFYTVNGTKLGQEIGLGNRINMIMQSAFFKLAQIIPEADAVEYLKDSIKKAYGKKGEKIVNMNYKAVDAGMNALVKVNIPANWADAKDAVKEEVNEPAFVKDIVRPMNAQEGDNLPVSTFNGIEDGTFPAGLAAYEKRGVAVNVPEWIVDNCIQCNQCAYICPHACIRPVLVNEEEMKNAPEKFDTKKAIGKGFEGLQYRMQVSPMDCTGCGNCADVCPAKEKALVMKPLDTQEVEVENWAFAVDTKKVAPKGDIMAPTTVKGSQFRQPLMEFSGACAGCGETPYLKLVTQLFGDRMMIANATGCSSIWGGSAPSTPYTVNHEGKGPSWANSLFEDNAEYGFGMFLGVKQMRAKLVETMEQLISMDICDAARTAFTNWLENREDSEASAKAAEEVLAVLANAHNIENAEIKALVAEIEARKDYLAKRSQWILGGDGWAYDIGYGGLDHVLASGENVNVLVFDTEIYSNTGGQASKSTPVAAMAKFAAAGKRSKKKDLGMMAMSYGNVYVAQVGMGADKNQLIKAVVEAEKYDGPSLIIAYSPCISHGLKEGMGRAQANIEQAVKCGYWHLYRFNPTLKAEGKNPFTLDSKEATESFRDFLMKQVRYSAIAKQFPDVAEELFEMAEENAKERYESYKRLAEQN
ncbi:pyruvate:ferredoxin (flavodoxin) oxidoreductase [Paraclostridium bifermentans]|jgi:pyruvate-ferredoxin/flavodoxin oxidoreductase|uniref:pyruvate:ferredoxin (flavodoxin) oxidoreductase n=1 Tax=Paraclostridium bifermentans TaxID=1490 RepID=UPI000DF853DB|nr:pyruvate:ferredoxin (flavodoxin) oxidoreductase [Paraclostridium bifermentans]MBS5952761.1 pyruvate:ferredoxin (flavodoxin) oxidoreductase [Paraclostridium bifermentans]MBU5288856.1 pyruvate:ferredoxin (flavodoxin) oxidoreductase [Paraclostridium bifermentans]MDU3335409.1 pyruvate:ferredoxin (flavodoxin) oxidoreductase [Paraclostridium bifermentans]RDC50087.1 pyruvate:ferredoxin (flavodoxin) oxidoreductase [Acinetobacter sp. RIT592]